MDKTPDPDPEQAALQIIHLMGELFGNLLSLELSLREILHAWEVEVGACEVSHPDEWRLGSVVPENALTTNDNLADLVEKANRLFAMRGLTHRIDRSLVDLRNGLAHGRLAVIFQPHIRIVIWRFSAPREGKVKVRFAQDMTPDWLDSQIRRTYEEMLKARQAGAQLGLL
jgi:hypothetical protein